MCQKIPYIDKADALEHAGYIKIQRKHYSKNLGRSKKSGRKLRAYDCRYCDSWHLTTLKN